MIRKIALSVLAFSVAAGIAVSQDKMADKKTSSGKVGTLQPTMDPTGGWTSQGDMGKKGDDWTATTKAAGVDNMPLKGKSVTLTGEILDLSCYLQLGKHGDKHAACGKKCLTSGEPIGLVTKSGDIYMLMAEEHDPRRDGMVSFRKTATDNFAKVMTVTGTETSVNGFKAVYVQGYTN